MSDLHSLIGETVTKVELSQDKHYLRFTLLNKSVVVWSAVGDCCSDSWFESAESFGFGGDHNRVCRVDCIDGPERDGGELKIYFCTVMGSCGRLCIEMRNSSNGYYGGSIVVSNEPRDQYDSAPRFDADNPAPVWNEVRP